MICIKNIIIRTAWGHHTQTDSMWKIKHRINIFSAHPKLGYWKKKKNVNIPE